MNGLISGRIPFDRPEENVITVAAIDRETFDEETFRSEVAQASKEAQDRADFQ